MDRLATNTGMGKDGKFTMPPTADLPVIGAYSPELSQQNWEKSKEAHRWDSSLLGRASIRLFSRGVLGAAAFAWGNYYVGRGKGMKGYKPDVAFSELEVRKPLMYVAKIIDSTAGNAIKSTAEFFGSENPERWVRFRPTNNANPEFGGRSLGHEAVGITFDFFCASVADAFGRDLAGIVDPNVKHSWKDDNGHIDYTEALKTAGKSLWRYVSYNGGEDWAVAVPYAYFLRGQRNIIGHFSPGFRWDSDRALNGGSFKVNSNGQVIGNYNLEGMIDLQGRFTIYNVGTLMYRELYNHVDNIIHGKPTSLYGTPVKDDDGKKKGILDKAGDVCKWIARSTVKGVIYMTPAVPFFSVFRTSQSKYRGMFINPENKSALEYIGAPLEDGKTNYQVMYAHELTREHNRDFTTNTPVNFHRFEPESKQWKTFGGQVHNHPLSNPNKPFDAYAQHTGVLNSIGKFQSNFRSEANKLVKNKFGTDFLDNRTMSSYWNAAFAYTPYMTAKAEAARIWDSGKMDMAAERMIDGAADLNFKEFKEGAKEVWSATIHPHKPFADPIREAMGQQRIHEDYSPSDSLNKEQIKMLHRDQYDKLPWQERVVQGSPPQKKSAEKKERQQFTPQNSYTDNAEMQRLLRDMIPPTNSVH